MSNKEYTTKVEVADIVKNTRKFGYPIGANVPLDPAFVDDRGSIQNLLNTPMNGAAIITSKKGSVRSNHWHKTDWHYLYVLSGSMEYWERPADPKENYRDEPEIFTAGQMVFTPPYMIHKTVFLEDTVLLSFSKRNRDHDSHEEDVVRENY